MPVDQKVPGRGVFILADARFDGRSAGQSWESLGHESPGFLRILHHSIAALRIERGAMPVEPNFHATVLEIGQNILAAVAAEVEPNRHLGRRELPISGGRTKVKYLLASRADSPFQNLREDLGQPGTASINENE